MNILVTGGAGYIGSHACKRLLAEGHRVVVIDNLRRGHEKPLELIRRLPGVRAQDLTFVRGDVGDRQLVASLLHDHGIETVIHFAALAYVRESTEQPLEYYRANTAAAVSLLEAIDTSAVTRLVFSSTCATYGEAPPNLIPIREDCPQVPINPYGWSKLFIERMATDLSDVRRRSRRPIAVGMLRYFNVAGCDRTGVLGEDHTPETHLIPIILQVAMGRRDALTIFGTDHATPDGTCVRDYIHVEDLVDAHVAVMNALNPGAYDLRAYNLGIGKGLSIREIIASVERVTGRTIPVKDGPRHPGDPPTLYCDPSKIARELGWTASIKDIDQIVRSAWDWFRANPDGYRGS
ncbi:MAG: UDP-glucose 4-epimerase GalE [Planctomycetota bacterium]|nr:UDP-glucose 4-epimerase GalE [Planctomycetota bacterium]